MIYKAPTSQKESGRVGWWVTYCAFSLALRQFHHRTDEHIYRGTVAKSEQLCEVWSISWRRGCKCYSEPKM